MNRRLGGETSTIQTVYLDGPIGGALSTHRLHYLRYDPAESKNLATDRPTVVKLLTQLADRR